MTDKSGSARTLLRNAAIALSIMPLIENIDESLEKEWNQETFEATDRAMNQFVEDLEKLGYLIVPTTDEQTSFDTSAQKLAEVQARLMQTEGPVQ